LKLYLSRHTEHLIDHGLVDVESRLEKRLYWRADLPEKPTFFGDHENAEGAYHRYIQRLSAATDGAIVHHRPPLRMANAVGQHATLSLTEIPTRNFWSDRISRCNELMTCRIEPRSGRVLLGGRAYLIGNDLRDQ
jgi:hypothetical protein